MHAGMTQRIHAKTCLTAPKTLSTPVSTENTPQISRSGGAWQHAMRHQQQPSFLTTPNQDKWAMAYARRMRDDASMARKMMFVPSNTSRTAEATATATPTQNWMTLHSWNAFS